MTIEELAGHLLARLEKEIARAEAGTVAVGGLTKVGTDLEALLKACAAGYAKGQGSSLDAELRKIGATRGAGSYARVLKDARRGALGSTVAESIASDLRAARSRVQAVIDLRNDNAHGNISLDAAAGHKVALASLAALLRPLA
jgi:hypothetical protein